MSFEQTHQQLAAMKLHGLAQAWDEQRQQAQATELSFDERFALLVDRQWRWREDRALATRLQYAHLKQSACLEDVDYRAPRGLQRALVDQLASGEWIRQHRNCLITGPTGVGKSFLGCALAQQACRLGFRALYCYLPKLARELTLAAADGSLSRLLRRLAKVDLLALDDLGLAALKADHYRCLLEVLDDRTGSGATLVTSQFPVASWHELIGEPTLADALLDRLVHNAYTFDLQGESLRKRRAKLA
jgi:DNA replication protein DnaC